MSGGAIANVWRVVLLGGARGRRVVLLGVARGRRVVLLGGARGRRVVLLGGAIQVLIIDHLLMSYPSHLR